MKALNGRIEIHGISRGGKIEPITRNNLAEVNDWLRSNIAEKLGCAVSDLPEGYGCIRLFDDDGNEVKPLRPA